MNTEDNTKNTRSLNIGIISLYGWLKLWDNYGTLLQNFALQTFLQKKGHETFWIRTRVAPSTQNRMEKFYVEGIDTLRSFLRLLATPILGVSRSKKLASFNARHPRYFNEFMARHIPVTPQEYTAQELIDAPPEVDALIVGSDQVWRDVTKVNFLGFGPHDITRIAYAVSAPWPALDKGWFESAVRYTPKFDAVSVREVEGVEVCNKLGRADVTHVLDPVLLLEASDYLDIIRQDEQDQQFATPFVLGYFVNIDNLEQIPWGPTVEFAHARGGDLLAVPMQGAELVIPNKYIYVPSPSEWMNAFHKTDCVVTNSYHGALFAIVMQKPFLVFLQDGAGSHQNGRFTSALKPLGLEDRLLTSDTWRDATPDELESRMAKPIDWGSVAVRLAEWRKISEEFLDQALKS